MQKTSMWIVAIGALVAGGCEGGGTTPGTDAGMGGRDSATTRSDAGDAATAGDGGSTPIDAGGPIDGFPDVPRSHVGHSDWNDLTLVSHNLVQNTETDFEELLLVVRNDDPSLTFCSVTFRVEFFDASGTSITFRTGTFDGDPRSVFTVDADCIPPGTLGLGYGNSSWSLPIEDVARIEYSFQGSGGTGTDVRTIATVSDEGQSVVDPYGGGLYWALEGTMRVLTGSLRNPSVTVFPLDARGLPYESLGQTDLISLSAGSSWPYETTAAEVRFTEYLVAHSFRGTGSPLVIDSPDVHAFVEARDHHAALRTAMDARRAGRL